MAYFFKWAIFSNRRRKKKLSFPFPYKVQCENCFLKRYSITSYGQCLRLMHLIFWGVSVFCPQYSIGGSLQLGGNLFKKWREFLRLPEKHFEGRAKWGAALPSPPRAVDANHGFPRSRGLGTHSPASSNGVRKTRNQIRVTYFCYLAPA